MTFSATATGVALPPLERTVQSVDVWFGDDRVWSIDLDELPKKGRGLIEWPQSLRPHLVGATRVVLTDSGSGRVLATTDARFTLDDTVTRVVDANGVPLAVNKWGRLGKTLGTNTGVQERILDRTEEVIVALEGLGLRPFVVGGTLLGAIREGALLPHDDDADLAYLSVHTNPVDVAAEGFAIGHQLEALGYELVRHSATHMQLYFRGGVGQLDYYVDVFAAFFTEDGNINQPFHVRGELRRDQMLPLGEVTIAGRQFPAPADPEAWLVINYDENWRTPIPGYRLQTPRATARRFQNWFGSFHHSRDFWNEHYEQHGVLGDDSWHTGRTWVLSQEPSLTSPWLLDLGAGTGNLAAELRNRGAHRTVIAADYSPEALRIAAGHAGDRFQTAHTNLYRNLSLALPAEAGIRGAFDVVGNHLIEHLGVHAFAQAMRLMRMALRSGGTAVATLYGTPDLEAEGQPPTSWGMPAEILVERALEYGLESVVTPLTPAPHEVGRDPYGVRFALAESPIKER